MEAYVLFARGNEEVIRFGEREQEEDIGCPSESSSSDGVDLADDASSSGSGSTTPTFHFEMAALMAHLPIKRGLSKFFDGKSQSFASLAAVGGLEDLPKPPPKRLKTSRSCCGGGGGGLKDDDAHRHRGPPSATATGNKRQASRSRARLTAPRRLVRARPLVAARPAAAAAGKPLLFA